MKARLKYKDALIIKLTFATKVIYISMFPMKFHHIQKCLSHSNEPYDPSNIQSFFFHTRTSVANVRSPSCLIPFRIVCSSWRNGCWWPSAGLQKFNSERFTADRKRNDDEQIQTKEVSTSLKLLTTPDLGLSCGK